HLEAAFIVLALNLIRVATKILHIRQFHRCFAALRVVGTHCRRKQIKRSALFTIWVWRLHHNYLRLIAEHFQKTSEEQLPECGPRAVCNKVDTYSKPWVEKQCRCTEDRTCSTSLDRNDGHSIIDKSRLLKTCEPVYTLPVCRYFRDVTWVLTSFADNTTSQQVHCLCPKNSVAYIFKHQVHQTQKGISYQYLFACSPESRLRCQRKEPCRLFTVKQRPDVLQVNTNTLCQCPRGQRCPSHHNDPHVLPTTSYSLEHINTFSGYCNFDYRPFDKKMAKYKLIFKALQKLEENEISEKNRIDVLPAAEDYFQANPV
ncbi:protein giant-lens-like protein, partial [Leptotrombidium deliense]